MELHSHVTQVRSHLEAAAALGDERTREVAAALASAAEPAVQLALVSALSAAADEITAALLDLPATPAVSARVTEAGVRFDVRAEQETPPPPDDSDTSARISLRLGEALKADIEAAARTESVSVNTWLVRAASSALTGARGPTRSSRTDPRDHHHITGWING
jgi:hypothetical protein